MKAFVFGKYSVGDNILFSKVKESLAIPVEHVGKKVDFSRIKPDDENILIILNRSIYDLDLTKILGYINKDKQKPLIVLKKIKTFGAVTFEQNVAIKDVLVNKIYVFAGVFYLPKDYIKSTMAETLKSINKEELRTYIIN